MNRWQSALKRHAASSPKRRAIKDDHSDFSWKDLESILNNLATIPIDWAIPLVIAGQRNAQTVIGVWWTLCSDGQGLAIERTQIATTLPRLGAVLGRHNLLIHEADLVGFSDLFRDLGYDEAQATVLDVFDADPILGRPLILPKLEGSHHHIPETCGWLLMTSGSTSQPKLVMIERQDLMARAESEISEFGISANEVVLNILPISHDVGFNQVLSSFVSGCSLIVQGHPSSERFRKNLREERVTGISGAPMMWLSFLRNNEGEEVFSAVRYLTISGGTLAVPDIQRLQKKFPRSSIYRTYGQTETFRSLIQKDTPGSEIRATHGSPVEKVRLSLVGENGDVIDGPGPGELVHEGVGTMLGYYPTIMPLRKVRTGDFFTQDAEGNYHYIGRRDDQIKRWEFRMHLSEVEEAIRTCPGVAQACVLSRPVPDGRQNALVGFVVLSGVDSSRVSESDLIDFCKKILAAPKVPDRIFIEAGLPETPSRKVDRATLMKMWEERDAGKKD